MKSTGAHFHVVRLQDDATLVRPVLLKGENQFLKRASHGSWRAAIAAVDQRVVSITGAPPRSIL
jgi:hypothetical protein